MLWRCVKLGIWVDVMQNTIRQCRYLLVLLLGLWTANVLSDMDPAALRALAETGDAMAQLNLGAAYDHGKGVERDLEQALYWYQQAAEQGLAEAQFNLAHLLAESEISEVAAAEWMAKAAAQGMLDAQFLMGVIYAEGLGVAQDPQRAREWLQRAIDAGHDDALDYLENHMPGR